MKKTVSPFFIICCSLAIIFSVTVSQVQASAAAVAHENKVVATYTSEHYFDVFQKDGPTLSVDSRAGGDLAGLSRDFSCDSLYSLRCEDTDEYVSFSLIKSRLAWAFGSDTYLSFSVFWNLKSQPIVNKKRQPVFEIRNGNTTKRFELAKVDYSTSGFYKSMAKVTLLDDLFVPNDGVTLALTNAKNETIRIPIPQDVLQQWQKVAQADLKKMAQEYDNGPL